jgi:structural maintenance of chromosome 1
LIHGAPIGKPVASTASVVAYYKDSNGTETSYSRTIVEHRTEHKSDWKSVYKINDKVKSAAEYNSALHKFGINIKAKNFLVFQGAVESIAMKTPKERTQLFEEISGSKEYITEYEEKKQAMSKAQEETAYSFQKKKGISLEKKEAKAEKEEAEKYKKVAEELVRIRYSNDLYDYIFPHNQFIMDNCFIG